MSEEPRDGATPSDEPEEALDRRGFLSRSSNLAMAAGLAAGYGSLGVVATRYLYPARPADRSWTFVTEVGRMQGGDSLLYRAPSGETINITRQGESGSADDFTALSSVCPHLGCQVHWEAHNERYFCPCHNGTFDSDGVGTGGPPGDAGQRLPRFVLKVENDLLFIEVETDSLATGGRGEVIDRRKEDARSAPGHDPCLSSLAGRNRRA